MLITKFLIYCMSVSLQSLWAGFSQFTAEYLTTNCFRLKSERIEEGTFQDGTEVQREESVLEVKCILCPRNNKLLYQEGHMCHLNLC